MNFIFNAKAEEARYRYEMLNLVRRDKFDFIMPGAMSDNDIDMWIHVIKRGDPDPFGLDLCANLGYFVFTDRGWDTIEMALFGVSFLQETQTTKVETFVLLLVI